MPDLSYSLLRCAICVTPISGRQGTTKNPSGAPTREGSKNRTCGRFGQKTPPEMAWAAPHGADAPRVEVLILVVTIVIIFRSRFRSFAPETNASGEGRGFYVALDLTSSAAKWPCAQAANTWISALIKAPGATARLSGAASVPPEWVSGLRLLSSLVWCRRCPGRCRRETGRSRPRRTSAQTA